MSQLMNRLIAKVITRFPSLAQRFVDGYQARETEGGIPWAPLQKPLAQCKVALVTTSGIHHTAQEPFDMQDTDGDPSYRELDGDSLFDDFTITHDYYDHKDAEKDPNIIFPLDRLKEFVTEGRLGALAKTHFSFMGHIDGKHIDTLVNRSAPEIAKRIQNDQVDLVLLTPA